MSVNEAILAAVTPTVPEIASGQYPGESDTYCTFNYTEHPSKFGDDDPDAALFDVQVHLFLPHNRNSLALRRGIRNGLIAQDFTHPTIYNMSDNEGQHFVFECEYTEGYDDA